MAGVEDTAEVGAKGKVPSWLRARRSLGRLAWAASPALVVAAATLTVVAGLLPAAFNVASGRWSAPFPRPSPPRPAPQQTTG